MSEKILLYKLILPKDAAENEVQELIFRGERPVWNGQKLGYDIERGKCDFSTFYNAFSLAKWMRYTIADRFFLELKMRGLFRIELYGYNTGEKKIIKRKLFSREYEYKKKSTIKIEIPKGRYNIVSFTVVTIEDTIIFDGAYYAEAESEFVKEPKIDIITTTYKKEYYIEKNYAVLNDLIFSDERLAPHFRWLIVDNGNSKELESFENDKVRVVHNPNTGGSGGFARGMIEVNHYKDKPTHIILTDDDIEFIPGSFERIYALLCIVKDEFKENFIAGAMLPEDKPYIQLEDLGCIGVNGKLGGFKTDMNMKFLSRVIANETEIPYSVMHYSAWWFCCIPMSVAKPDNLPMPFFIRDDDVEYSLRNRSGIITMNAIGVRHEGFTVRFSGFNEYYLGMRNELILSAIYDELKKCNVFQMVKDVFNNEIYKYNYKGAGLVLRAIEDYLKGPEFLKNVNPSKLLPEIKTMDNEYRPLTKEVTELTGFKKLKKRYDLGSFKKFIYDYTCNGQKFISRVPVSRKGVIEKGWKYCVEKQFFAKEVYSIDAKAGTYAVYKRDLSKFKDIMKRFSKLEARYMAENDSVAAAYRAAAKELHSEEFWSEYFRKLEEEG